jgi:N-acylneuraminate cytidylyltransferase
MPHTPENTFPVLIPARGGSKGVPGKNVRPLAGKPLLAHSIEQAKAASMAGDVYVSTDAPEIAEVADRAGARVIARPPELSTDTATSEAALAHGLDTIQAESGRTPEFLIFLQCTSPIRTPQDIDAAVLACLEQKLDSLLSVAPSHRFLWTGQGKEGPGPINFDFKNRLRRQELPPQYVENGSIYVFRPDILRTGNNRLGGRIGLHVMAEESSYEIDSLLDFQIVEFIMQHKGYLL